MTSLVQTEHGFSDEELAEINQACDEGWQEYLDGKAVPAETLLERLKL